MKEIFSCGYILTTYCDELDHNIDVIIDGSIEQGVYEGEELECYPVRYMDRIGHTYYTNGEWITELEESVNDEED